jgi:hypothetical protein
MTIANYAQLQQYMTQILTENISSQSGNTEESDAENMAPHGAFWNTLSYEDFVTGSVLGSYPILEKGSSATSNIILALRGETPFNGDPMPRMPADGPPWFTEEQIQTIADWIDAGCPNGTTEGVDETEEESDY